MTWWYRWLCRLSGVLGAVCECPAGGRNPRGSGFGGTRRSRWGPAPSGLPWFPASGLGSAREAELAVLGPSEGEQRLPEGALPLPTWVRWDSRSQPLTKACSEVGRVHIWSDCGRKALPGKFAEGPIVPGDRWPLRAAGQWAEGDNLSFGSSLSILSAVHSVGASSLPLTGPPTLQTCQVHTPTSGYQGNGLS